MQDETVMPPYSPGSCSARCCKQFNTDVEVAVLPYRYHVEGFDMVAGTFHMAAEPWAESWLVTEALSDPCMAVERYNDAQSKSLLERCCELWTKLW